MKKLEIIKKLLLEERRALVDWIDDNSDEPVGVIYLELQIKFIDKILKEVSK